MKTRLVIVASLLASTALVGCASPRTPKFYWGGYERALYVYAKAPDKKEIYRAELEKTIKQGRATNMVAPGLLAELGYLYLEEHDTARAVPLFEEEMSRFPESRPFLTKIVERAKRSDTSASPSTKAAQ